MFQIFKIVIQSHSLTHANISTKLSVPQIIARQLVWQRDVYQHLHLMVFRMFSLLKTSEQLIWVLLGPNPYPGYYFLPGHSHQVFWSKVWLSEIFQFYHWVQEKDNAYLKLKVDIRAEAGPSNCPLLWSVFLLGTLRIPSFIFCANSIGYTFYKQNIEWGCRPSFSVSE